MQGLSVIGRNGATDWPQHKITRQQKEEIAECQQKTWPLTLADIDQVQGKPTLGAYPGIEAVARRSHCMIETT